VKWDGYRVIARKEGDRVRVWARAFSVRLIINFKKKKSPTNRSSPGSR
jgi:hypothetical protein